MIDGPAESDGAGGAAGEGEKRMTNINGILCALGLFLFVVMATVIGIAR